MKNLILFISTLVTLSMTSCVPTMYSPNVVNTPMLSEKGEGHVVASTNIDVSPILFDNYTPRQYNNKGVFDQFDVSTSYAITDKIGIQANAVYVKPRDLDDEQYGSGYMGEIGVGYFKRLSSKFIFESYGLLGYGQAENHFVGSYAYGNDFLLDIPDPDYSTKDYHLYSDIVRIGFQPSIAYKRKHFFMSMATRFSNLNFINVQGRLVFEGEDIAKDLKENGKNNWIVEPAFTIGADIDQFRFQFQTGLHFNGGEVQTGAEGGFSTIGLGYNLVPKKKNQKVE